MPQPIIDDRILSALPRVARDHALQLEDAAHRRDDFGVIVWAAVLLEAMLEDVLRRLALSGSARNKDGPPDLGGQLATLTGHFKSDAEAQEMMSRCHSIRVIRNRCVHDTGRTKDTLGVDAMSVRQNISLVAAWWLGQGTRASDTTPPRRARVFISTITPDQPRHRGFLADLRAALEEMGLEPVSVELTEYDRKQPLARVAAEMATCHAVLVVGLERTRAYLVRDREGTDREREYTHRRYSSAWLDLEAGLAFGLGLGERVFVICEQDIVSAGVFDRDWNQFTVVQPERMDVRDPAVRKTLTLLAACAVAAAGAASNAAAP